MALNPQEAQRIIKEHFRTVTPQEFVRNILSYDPDLLAEVATESERRDTLALQLAEKYSPEIAEQTRRILAIFDEGMDQGGILYSRIIIPNAEQMKEMALAQAEIITKLRDLFDELMNAIVAPKGEAQ